MVSANLMILSLKGSVSCTVITLLPKLVCPYFLEPAPVKNEVFIETLRNLRDKSLDTP